MGVAIDGHMITQTRDACKMSRLVVGAKLKCHPCLPSRTVIPAAGLFECGFADLASSVKSW